MTSDVRHPVLVYSLLRLLLFAVVAGVLYLLGARDVLLLALAVLLSGLLSFPLLSRYRDAMSARVAGRSERIQSRLREAAESEDDRPTPQH